MGNAHDGEASSTCRDDDTAGSTAPQQKDFRSGHAVHWIQAKKAAERRHEAETGRIASVDGDVLTVVVHGQRRVYRVADPIWVSDQVARYGRQVEVQERWSVIRIGKVLVQVGRSWQV